MREGDEVHIDRKQHQLERHQQHDHVLAVQENANDADCEEDRTEHEEVGEREHSVILRA
ncbi:hypothetical protein D3C86_1981930 [compost metagenome]